MGEIRKHAPHVKWTAAEVGVLTAHYPSAPHETLLLLLPGRGIRVIQCKANGLGLIRSRPPARTKEQVREAKRLQMALRYHADIETSRAYGRAHHARHKEAVNAQRRGDHKTRLFWVRALRYRGITARQLASLWRKQRGRCALTGNRLGRDAELDHKTPRARGGANDLSNLQWVTPVANRAKRDLTDAEFLALCQSCVRWIGERIAAVDAISIEKDAS